MPELDQACAELAGLAAHLRDAGLEIGYPQIEVAAAALIAGPRGDDEFAYWALRSALASSPDEGEVFDRVWKGWPGEVSCPRTGDDPESGDPPVPGDSADLTGGQAAGLAAEDGEGEDESGEKTAGAEFSPTERLRHLDFSLYGPEEERLARTALRRLATRLPQRRSRRQRPSNRRARLDFPRTLRGSVRTAGHPVELVWSGPLRQERQMVFLIDVSGSMQPYSAPVLVLAHALRRLSRRIEVFTFGTRLTHLSRDALSRNSQAGWNEAVGREVPDWAGGTRIGESLAAYTRLWGRSGMSRGAVVTVLSDGWERGAASQVDTAMAGIARLARRVIWLNPLAGRPGYRPLAGGMAAALPYVDTLLPAASIADLERFIEELALLPRSASMATPGPRRRRPGR